MKRSILGLFVLAVVALGCAGGLTPAAQAPSVATPASVRGELWVHHFNDWHGHLEPFDREGTEVGGAARLFTAVAQRRAAAEAAGADEVLMVAGDVLQGTPMSTVFRGRPDYELLRRLGVDAFCLGNHEFDFGREVLNERISEVDFPVLAANVFDGEGKLFRPPTTVLTTGKGYRIGVVGVLTDETAHLVLPELLGDLTFEDPVDSVRPYAADLASSTDLVVVLSHSGYEVDLELARLPGVDAVIGAHDQILFEEMVGGVPVVQAREWGEWVGELRFKVGGGQPAELLGIDRHRVTAELAPNPEVEAFVAGFRTRLGEEMAEVLSVARVRLEGEREAVRSRETNLGDLLSDVVRQVARADIALLNGGTIRAPIDAGPITLEEILQVLPFENEIVVMEVPGARLQEALDRSAGLGPTDGGFLQVSGMRLVIEDERTQVLEAAGASFDPERTYRVATTNFLAQGGDGYALFAKLPMSETGYQLNSVVVDWLRKQDEVVGEVDGRILRR